MPNSLQHCGLQHVRPLYPPWSLLSFVSIESVMPSNHLILHHPALPLPSIFPSIRVFSSDLNQEVLNYPPQCEWIFSSQLKTERKRLMSLEEERILPPGSTLEFSSINSSQVSSLLTCLADFRLATHNCVGQFLKFSLTHMCTHILYWFSLSLGAADKCIIKSPNQKVMLKKKKKKVMLERICGLF